MRHKTQPLAGGRRRVTDEQVYLLQTWMPFTQLARRCGVSFNYAKRIRKGLVVHKNASP